MTGFLSIIWRELAVGARQKATQRARLIAAAIIMAIFMAVLLLSRLPPQSLGRTLFAVTFFILYLQALFSGIRLTSDCLSEEKREGTLGLLYLSGLRGSGIVLGKMAVRSLRGIYTLIATLPIFGLCILIGGIEGSDAFKAGISLLVTMFYSLSLAVMVSAIATDEKAVFAGALGLILGLSIVPNAAWWFILKINPAATWADYVFWISPWQSGVKDFWQRLIFQLFICSSLLVASAWFLNRSFKTQFTNAPSAASLKQTKSRVNVRLDDDPILWLLSLDTFSKKIAKLYFIVMFCGSAAIVFMASKNTAFSMGPFMILYGFHLAWKFLVLSDALRWLHHDSRSGALEILLTTPIDPSRILAAQAEHTFRLFVPSAMGLIIANLACYGFHNFANDLVLIPIGGAIFLFIDGMALRWTAMAQAFKPTRFPAAVILLAAKVLVVPTLLLWLFVITARSFATGDIHALFLFWFIACGIYDAILIRGAKARLQNLRQLASDEPPPEKSTRRPLPKAIQWLILDEPTLPETSSSP